MNFLSAEKTIDVIFFDQGGVLVVDRIRSGSGGEEELEKIKEILGLNVRNEELRKRLEAGEEKYKKTGMENLIEEDEDIIWQKYLLPEYPDKKLLKEQAETLTLLYFQVKGPRYYRPDAKKVVVELKRRGYKVGLISNTWSKKLVHQEINNENFNGLFNEIVLSSETNLRKPHIDMFIKPVERLGSKVSNAVYIGDQPNRDVEGPRNAGYGMVGILRTDKMKNLDSLPPNHKPDFFINSLEELLQIFPSKS